MSRSEEKKSGSDPHFQENEGLTPIFSPIGLFGGTFDPIHQGHLRLAEEAREALGLAEIRFIPAGVPPHRDTPGSSAEHRLEMVRRAIASNPAFTCDDLEVFSQGKSYTVLTLERLRERFGASQPLVLILGADAFAGLSGWHRHDELLKLAHIAVANRPGYGKGENWGQTLISARNEGLTPIFSSPAGQVVEFDMTPLAISATHIRELVANGHSARYLLPDSVLDYIALHNLYR